MPLGEKSQERHQIPIANYQTYDGLPLVSSGCDSYASWMPEFKHLSPMLTVDAIADRVCDLLPYGEWRDEHLVITGGEPLLGWQRAYPDLLNHPKMQGLKEITFETNGTQSLSDELKSYLHQWRKKNSNREITFSISAKLPCSGEKWEDAICPQIICEYEWFGTAYLKFVVANEQDVLDAQRAVDEYRQAGFTGHVYLMPVGGVESVYVLNNKTVALEALKHGWRYSDRLQVPLFKNAWAT